MLLKLLDQLLLLVDLTRHRDVHNMDSPCVYYAAGLTCRVPMLTENQHNILDLQVQCTKASDHATMTSLVLNPDPFTQRSLCQCMQECFVAALC